MLQVRRPLVAGLREHVRYVDERAVQRHASDERLAIDRGRVGSLVVAERLVAADRGDEPEDVAVTAEQIAEVAAAELRGVVDDDVEHGLQVERRLADRLEHVGHRGLALERLLRLVEQTNVLDR